MARELQCMGIEKVSIPEVYCENSTTTTLLSLKSNRKTSHLVNIYVGIKTWLVVKKDPYYGGVHKSCNKIKFVSGENFPNMPDVTATFQKA